MQSNPDTAGPLYLGVDGGGSKCRVRLRDERGAFLGRFEGGTANVYLDFDTAIRNIRSCIGECLAAAGLPESSTARLHLGLGLAGVSTDIVATRVASQLDGFAAVKVTHDAEIACLGAHGGQDGGLIIAGTGSAAVARVRGQTTPIGGRGFIMGDDGSGARLGLDALRHALRAQDGLEPHTGLTRDLMAAFHDDPVAVIEWGRSARSSDFGAYAPLVIRAAAENDPLGLLLVRDAAAAIADLGRVLGRHGAERLALVGGLAAAITPYLPPATLALLREPMFDPLEGALLLGGCPLPRAETPQ
jgi:glucosamine kinase